MSRMTSTVILVAVLISSGSASSSNDAEESQMSVQAMETVFARSEKSHAAHMAAITSTMTVAKAVEVLHKHNLGSAALTEVTDMALGAKNLRKQPKGYSGIDGARKLLNDMIFESMTKYDAEIAKCTEYYAKQCAAMEVCRGQISAANYIAANSRQLILDSQSTINLCEVAIPELEAELKAHNLKCKHELKRLNTRLKIVMGDIAVMTMILEMTDCEKKLLQTNKLSMLSCEDQCSKKKFIKFDHDGLQQKVSQLQSTLSQDLMADTFKDLFTGVAEIQSWEFLQTGSQQVPNKTQFNNPPVPRTKVPSNPCNDPDKGAPSAADKRAAKCTIKKSPQCYKLQERFLLIQAGIQDERDELLDEISMLETFCEEQKKTLETQIQNDKDMLSAAQTKLAAATEKEANAGEDARQTNTKNTELNNDLLKQMKTCSGNYINFETELCALKKIRGELYKMKGGGHSAFFQDCEVAKWSPEECTKKCATGEQKLVRGVLTHPNGGAKCLPLAAMRSCNQSPCPVDCRLKTWSGWSKCSAKCGGGVQQRLREVKQAMKYGGKECGSTSETRPCNIPACEEDCKLSGWTRWSSCSKDCDGGTKKRQKFVHKPARGEGECPGQWSTKRLQYKKCNMKRCMVAAADKPMLCNQSMDVVLLIDGSGSLGQKGWNAEIKAAQFFVDAFSQAPAGAANMAVILYSGPRTWGGVFKCFGRNRAKVDQEKVCGIKTVTHFTTDMPKVKQLITGLKWPKGSTLTSLALMTAKAELGLGRSKERSRVIIITDGRPLSYRATGMASRALRKTARLVWVPVTKYAPLKRIKRWATRKWQENVVKVNSFTDLSKPDAVTHIIADICPKQGPKVKFGRR